jgi:murein DD-endopeptidase MepM/ murein hydrolase activator NlpD
MNQPLWQRYGSHVAFLFLLGLFFIGVGVIGATSQPTTEENPAGELAFTSSNNTSNPTFLEAETTQAETPLPTVDLGVVPVLNDTSLSPDLDPHTFVGKKPEHNFQTYVVEAGDAPASIAEKFKIKTETILGGNPKLSNEASALQTGTELIILPVDGVLHDVQKGETLEGVSEKYGVPVEDIIAYAPNNLEFPYRLYEDTQILIPGATPDVGFVWNPPSISTIRGNNSCDIGCGNGTFWVQGTGRHVWPIGARNLSQSYWFGHQAIDVSASEGSSVVASDTGTVTWAAWNVYCYGNLVVVNHGNGYETFYAHLNTIGVTAGQIVQQGQYLGTSGNTGCSSGPHLHYEIRYNTVRDNPLNYLP